MQIIIIVMLGCVLGGVLFALLQSARTGPRREEMARLKAWFDQGQKQIEELQAKAQRVDELSFAQCAARR